MAVSDKISLAVENFLRAEPAKPLPTWMSSQVYRIPRAAVFKHLGEIAKRRGTTSNSDVCSAVWRESPTFTNPSGEKRRRRRFEFVTRRFRESAGKSITSPGGAEMILCSCFLACRQRQSMRRISTLTASGPRSGSGASGPRPFITQRGSSHFSLKRRYT